MTYSSTKTLQDLVEDPGLPPDNLNYPQYIDTGTPIDQGGFSGLLFALLECVNRSSVCTRKVASFKPTLCWSTEKMMVHR